MDRKRYRSFTFRNTDDQKILESDWYKGIASTLNQDCYSKMLSSHNDYFHAKN